MCFVLGYGQGNTFIKARPRAGLTVALFLFRGPLSQSLKPASECCVAGVGPRSCLATKTNAETLPSHVFVRGTGSAGLQFFVCAPGGVHLGA